MAYNNNPGQGAMFPRDKQGNPNRPDYSGTVNVAGHEYDISAWVKTSRAGNQYISLTVTEPYTQQAAPQPQPQYQQQPYQQSAPRAPQQSVAQQAPRPRQPRPAAPPQPANAEQYYQQTPPAAPGADGEQDLPF